MALSKLSFVEHDITFSFVYDRHAETLTISMDSPHQPSKLNKWTNMLVVFHTDQFGYQVGRNVTLQNERDASPTVRTLDDALIDHRFGLAICANPMYFSDKEVSFKDARYGIGITEDGIRLIR